MGARNLSPAAVVALVGRAMVMSQLGPSAGRGRLTCSSHPRRSAGSTTPDRLDEELHSGDRPAIAGRSLSSRGQRQVPDPQPRVGEGPKSCMPPPQRRYPMRTKPPGSCAAHGPHEVRMRLSQATGEWPWAPTVSYRPRHVRPDPSALRLHMCGPASDGLIPPLFTCKTRLTLRPPTPPTRNVTRSGRTSPILGIQPKRTRRYVGRVGPARVVHRLEETS